MRQSGRFIDVTYRFWQEDDQWVGLCEELDVSSFGSTLEEAREMTFDAVAVHLAGLEEFGQLDRVLRGKGLTMKRVEHPARPTAEPRSVGLGELVERNRIGIRALA